MPNRDDEDEDEEDRPTTDISDDDDMADIIQSAMEDDADSLGIKRISTFKEAGVMTRDAGMVIKMRDGSEYQVTVVQSR